MRRYLKVIRSSIHNTSLRWILSFTSLQNACHLGFSSLLDRLFGFLSDGFPRPAPERVSSKRGGTWTWVSWRLKDFPLFRKNRGVQSELPLADFASDVMSTSWSGQYSRSDPSRPVEIGVRGVVRYESFLPRTHGCAPFSRTVDVKELVEVAEPAPTNEG